MKLTQVKLDTLTPHPENYNRHPEVQLTELQKSLDTFNQFKNIVVCQGRIVAGHGLVEAAKRQGMTHLDALVRDDLTPEQERALLVADNALPFLSEPDPIALEALLANAPADIPGVTNEWLENMGCIEPQIIDRDKEWEGMPEFEQEDQLPFRTITVKFDTQEDFVLFCKTLEQTLTPETKYFWFPCRPERMSDQLGTKAGLVYTIKNGA